METNYEELFYKHAQHITDIDRTVVLTDIGFLAAIREFVVNDDMSHPETKIELIERIIEKQKEIDQLNKQLGFDDFKISLGLQYIIRKTRDEFKDILTDPVATASAQDDDLKIISNMVEYLDRISKIMAQKC